MGINIALRHITALFHLVSKFSETFRGMVQPRSASVETGESKHAQTPTPPWIPNSLAESVYVIQGNGWKEHFGYVGRSHALFCDEGVLCEDSSISWRFPDAQWVSRMEIRHVMCPLHIQLLSYDELLDSDVLVWEGKTDAASAGLDVMIRLNDNSFESNQEPIRHAGASKLWKLCFSNLNSEDDVQQAEQILAALVIHASSPWPLKWLFSIKCPSMDAFVVHFAQDRLEELLSLHIRNLHFRGEQEYDSSFTFILNSNFFCDFVEPVYLSRQRLVQDVRCRAACRIADKERSVRLTTSSPLRIALFKEFLAIVSRMVDVLRRPFHDVTSKTFSINAALVCTNYTDLPICLKQSGCATALRVDPRNSTCDFNWSLFRGEWPPRLCFAVFVEGECSSFSDDSVDPMAADEWTALALSVPSIKPRSSPLPTTLWIRSFTDLNGTSRVDCYGTHVITSPSAFVSQPLQFRANGPFSNLYSGVLEAPRCDLMSYSSAESYAVESLFSPSVGNSTEVFLRLNDQWQWSTPVSLSADESSGSSPTVLDLLTTSSDRKTTVAATLIDVSAPADTHTHAAVAPVLRQTHKGPRIVVIRGILRFSNMLSRGVRVALMDPPKEVTNTEQTTVQLDLEAGEACYANELPDNASSGLQISLTLLEPSSLSTPRKHSLPRSFIITKEVLTKLKSGEEGPLASFPGTAIVSRDDRDLVSLLIRPNLGKVGSLHHVQPSRFDFLFTFTGCRRDLSLLSNSLPQPASS